MKIGLMSDIHLVRNTQRLMYALEALEGTELLLLAGDLTDKGLPEQYALLLACIRARLGDVPVYCVSGNHDNPKRDDAAYRAFERSIRPDAAAGADASGAFHQDLGGGVDLTGLNPVYHQKLFFFPDRALQLDFLQRQLESSPAALHIVLCHPPLLAHNPQRTAAMPPYIAKEQNDRLQRITDRTGSILFLSGHTHLAPTVEWDAVHGNLYINAGSICPTNKGSAGGEIQQGNVTLLDITDGRVSVHIRGIHTDVQFFRQDFIMG